MERRVGDSDRAERDIDAARLIDHGPQVPGLACLAHRLLPPSAANPADTIFRDSFNLRPMAPGEKKLSRLVRKGCATALPSAPAAPQINATLVLEPHVSV